MVVRAGKGALGSICFVLADGPEGVGVEASCCVAGDAVLFFVAFSLLFGLLQAVRANRQAGRSQVVLLSRSLMVQENTLGLGKPQAALMGRKA